MQARISRGNRKLGSIPNVSLRPIADCANCEHCKKSCYALKAWRMYENVRDAWKSNAAMVHGKHRVKYFEDVDAFIKKRKPKYFRWHVAGDILDQDYYQWMVAIAKRHPNTKFLCFTKRFDLKFSGRPKNLAVVLSMFPGMKVPKKEMPRAWMQDGTEHRIPKNTIECQGDCTVCNACWHLNKNKKDVYFHKH